MVAEVSWPKVINTVPFIFHMSNSFNVNISACFDSVFSFLFPLSFELDTSLFIIKFSILFLRPRSSEIRILLFQGRIKVYLQYILEIFNFLGLYSHFSFFPLLYNTGLKVLLLPYTFRMNTS